MGSCSFSLVVKKPPSGGFGFLLKIRSQLDSNFSLSSGGLCKTSRISSFHFQRLFQLGRCSGGHFQTISPLRTAVLYIEVAIKSTFRADVGNDWLTHVPCAFLSIALTNAIGSLSLVI